MDLSKYLGDVSLFIQFAKIDAELEKRQLLKHCPHCGHHLHHAPYERKPRGALCELPRVCSIRLSLCCGHCRRRCLPPSCLFLGPKVYYACIILFLTAILQGLTKQTIQFLCDKIKVSRRTLHRWFLLFRDLFPKSPLWKSMRGLLPSSIAGLLMPLGLLQSDFDLTFTCCFLVAGISPNSVAMNEGPVML